MKPPQASPASDAPAHDRSPVAGTVILAAVLAGGIFFALSGDVGPGIVARGSPAPDFELPRLSAPSKAGPAANPAYPAGSGSDSTISLREFAGEVVLVNFWATWCKPCEDEIPAMERLYQALRGEGFALVAISVDQSSDDVAAFRQRHAMSFPIALDREQAVSRRYQTTGFPESLLVDRDGLVVERYVGPRDWDHPSYFERIRKLLAQ